MRILASLLLLLALTACQSNGNSGSASEQTQTETTGSVQAAWFEGPVVETVDAGGYTYVLVDADGEKVWAAGPQQPLEVGTSVKISKAMPMQNFHSPALERDFETIYFVSEFGDHEHAEGETGAHTMMGGHGGAMGGATEPAGEVDLTGIEPADHTVAAVYQGKEALAGKTVRVRGRVVKSLTGIMGTNWLHLKDGTGQAGTDDLTVTTAGTAPVGATVLIEGTLTVDKDFGSGYRYDVIVENAVVTVE